ncbi:uncharacterized protein A4U43_C01F9040 [Asparagus officinalis]|uniref:Uncharacterized protein n=1 Tax=Asparagus officinalis TaxID=4686 RepID=A0A5P1FRT3_ASPOF|nr:uncharacterized protein A4U43_C01F9040 [Asparagus officinalis]
MYAVVMFQITTIIWLVKIILIKLLASSFHVNIFFGRKRKERVFHYYVLGALSGDTIAEEEEEEEANDHHVVMSRMKRLTRVTRMAFDVGRLVRHVMRTGLTTVSWMMDRVEEQFGEAEVTSEWEARYASEPVIRNVARLAIVVATTQGSHLVPPLPQPSISPLESDPSDLTCAIVTFQITTIIWLVKIILIKLLASSFHVNIFFGRMKERVFHYYVIGVLSGDPITEEEEEEEANDHHVVMSRMKRLTRATRMSFDVGRLARHVMCTGLTMVSWTVDRVEEQFGEAKAEVTREWEARHAAEPVFRNVVRLVSEPSTSGRAATATATSRSRTPQQSYKKPNSIGNKKLKKALLSKLRKVMEAPKTFKEQQEEVASLVDLCLRHVDQQAENVPAPAGPADDDDGATDHEDDREGSDDA